MVQVPETLRVRSRQTLLGDGGVCTDLSVPCPASGDVPIERCAHCERSSGFRLGPRTNELRVVCVAEEIDQGLWKERTNMHRADADQAIVSEIMATNVVCVSKDVKLDTVRDLFLELGISGAPVVEADGRPIGVVSKTDLLRESQTRPRESDTEAPLVSEAMSSMSVEDVMMPIAFCLPENESIARAAALMAFEGVHRVPVVGPRGQVVGLVSPLDILGWLARRHGWVVADLHAR
jgi:CBS domain-containing protein